MYSTQQVFPPAVHPYGQRVLVVKSNGGSVAVEVQLNPATNTWVTSDTKSSDGAFVLACGGSTIRITPTGGATFNLT
jgi:hypothetical protein